jgi:hypothetical protein
MRIPRIKKWDNNIYVFEIGIVDVSRILDFGGSYLDYPPEHVQRERNLDAEQSWGT